MTHAEQAQNELRRIAEHYERQVQLERIQQEDDEGPHEAAAIIYATLIGLFLWATAIGTGYLLFF